MNLFGTRHPRFWKRKFTATSGSDVLFEAAPASGLDDLQVRLNQWSHVWAHENDSGTPTEAQRLVAKRLTDWMDRCFGQHVHQTLRGKGGQISLATTTPIFTAFLGRRATRELSRRVLQDI